MYACLQPQRNDYVWKPIQIYVGGGRECLIWCSPTGYSGPVICKKCDRLQVEDSVGNRCGSVGSTRGILLLLLLLLPWLDLLMRVFENSNVLVVGNVRSGNWAHVSSSGLLRLGMRGGDGPLQVEGGGSPTQEHNNRAVFVVTER